MHNTKRNVIVDTNATFTGLGEVNKYDYLNREEDRRNYTVLEYEDYTLLHTCFFKLKAKIGKDVADETGLGKTGFHFNGIEYSFMPHHCTFLHRNSGAGGSVEGEREGGKTEIRLFFRRVHDSPQKWIQLTYSLYRRAKQDKFVLSFIGNPTTLINGNNVSPIRVDDASIFKENLAYFQIGYDVLEAILEEFKFRWSEKSKERIKNGDIVISNAQWAMYLNSKNKKLDMSLLAGLYFGRRISKNHSNSLGEYLGFETKNVLKKGANKITGLFMCKHSGNHPSLTINFYDKVEDVANKRQTKALTAAESNTLDNVIRLDITGHPLFLKSIVNAAKKHGNSVFELLPKERKKYAAFLDSPTVDNTTAFVLCKAIALLSYRIEFDDVKKKKVLVRQTFTDWLLRRIIETELKLFSILNYNIQSLHRLNSADEKINRILEFWKRGKFKSEHVEKDVAKLLNESERNARRHVSKIYDTFGLDINIPIDYWLDLEYLTTAYGLSLKEQLLYKQVMFDENIDPGYRAEVLNELNNKSKKKFKDGQQTLLSSLKLQPVFLPANPYAPKLLNEKRK